MRHLSHASGPGSKSSEKRFKVFVSATFCSIMGVTWLLAILMLSADGTTLTIVSYAFTILNAFTGVWIFAFHGGMEANMWRRAGSKLSTFAFRSSRSSSNSKHQKGSTRFQQRGGRGGVGASARGGAVWSSSQASSSAAESSRGISSPPTDVSSNSRPSAARSAPWIRRPTTSIDVAPVCVKHDSSMYENSAGDVSIPADDWSNVVVDVEQSCDSSGEDDQAVYEIAGDHVVDATGPFDGDDARQDTEQGSPHSEGYIGIQALAHTQSSSPFSEGPEQYTIAVDRDDDDGGVTASSHSNDLSSDRRPLGSSAARSISVADLARECGEWDKEALAAHPITAFATHIRSSRMRVIDIFKVLDARCGSNGRLSDTDMVLALKEMGIPLSDSQIVDLVKQIEHEPGQKITYASLKHTIEHHRVSVLRPLRKERESWIHHPMRQYSIKTGHRKRTTSSASSNPPVTSPQWDPTAEVKPDDNDEWRDSGIEVPRMSTTSAIANMEHLTSPHRLGRNSSSPQTQQKSPRTSTANNATLARKGSLTASECSSQASPGRSATKSTEV